jgi:hypothetical protein
MEDMSELPLLTIVVNSPNKALPSLNALKRQTGRYVGNGWRKTFEEAVAAYKRALPWSVQKQFPLAKATVLYTYYHRGIVQDQDNFAGGTQKLFNDALVRQGVLVDDRPSVLRRHPRDPVQVRVQSAQMRRLVVEVWEGWQDDPYSAAGGG